MIVFLLFEALALLSLPMVLRRAGRRLPPARWARLIAVSLAGGSALWILALSLLALPTLLHAVQAAGLANACSRALGAPHGVHGSVVGWLAAGVLGFSMARGVRARVRFHENQRLTHVEAWLGDHKMCADHELVLLTSDDFVAISVASEPAQIVVSTGLVGALSPDALDAVLDHERVHLRRRHDRYLLLAEVVSRGLGYVPTIGSAATALETALERWADEEAAAVGPNSREHVREALWSVTATLVGPAVAAFANAATVIERIAALEQPPPQAALRGSLLVSGAVVSLSMLGLFTLFAGHDEFGLLAAALRLCPH